MSWPTVKLGDVVNFIGGSQPPKLDFIYKERKGYIRLIQTRDYKSDKNLTYIPIEKSRRFCTKDDVMIGRYGPPVFQILRGLEGSYNVALMKAEPTKQVDREFLYYFLKQDKLFKLIDGLSQRTSGQTGIDMDALKAYPMLLPPLAEQKRIATILDKADAIRRKRQQTIQLADEFLRAVFLDMFGDPVTNPKGWKVRSFGEFTTLQQGLQIPISDRKSKKGKDCFKYLTVKYLNGKGESEYIHNPRKSVLVNKDQVLMTRTGNTGQIITGVEGVFHNNFFRIDFDPSIVEKEFMVYFLSYPAIRSKILKLASTTTIPDLNHCDFLNFTIFLPSRELQNSFSNIVSRVSKLRQGNENVLFENVFLLNSLSQKAFSGQL